ncbi:hypothetical protein [Ruficoccus sp. ZRK36]|uniref:hypothetical protein n=1 Tax=Ruficoccus sp. ZRK36 TaxID=2866311 RepID=UPI001C73B48E|nr:hypothetical protein [Ruficoccus sp. ZRK36]QYY37266.1 hypothetical protein K0V07_07225 [Ruficoccus sp. ZRK36]
MIKSFVLPILVGTLVSIQSGYSQDVYQENFSPAEGHGQYAPDAVIPEGKSTKWAQAINNPNNGITAFVRQDDTNQIFGQGPDNLYGAFSDTIADATVPVERTSGVRMMAGKLSLDFYDPGQGSSSNWVFRLCVGGASNSRTVFGFILLNKGDGTGFLCPAEGPHVNPPRDLPMLGSYPTNARNALVLVFNNRSDSTVLNYDGGTVAAGRMDIWLNGQLIADDAGAANSLQGSPITNLNFTLKSGGHGTIYLDNITLTEL